MNRLFLIILGLFCWTFIFGQQLISPFGGFMENNNGSLSFTVGEPIVHTMINDNEAATQGFQQPEVFKIETLNLEYANGLILDADNENGTFILQGVEEYPNNQIIILNRWGDVVYQAQPYQNNWKGYRNNEPLPQATYYFIFYADETRSQVVKGNIYLLKQ